MNSIWRIIIFKIMNINNLYKSQSDLFKILAHPVRLTILEILREGEQCVCHIEAMLGLRQAYIPQHLMVLREAGVVADRRDGWNMYYRVIKPEVFAVLDAMVALTGSHVKIVHQHSNKECPCPKCNAEGQVIPSQDVAVLSK
jgi:DNA-binding transcriptional ArsR family regulator